MESTLSCPQGCGALSVFIARRGRRQRPYLGCRSCGFTEWRGGNTAYDSCCADGITQPDPPVQYGEIDSVSGMDPYPESSDA